MTAPLIERFPRTEQLGNVLQTTLSSPISTTTRPVTVTPTSTAGWPTTPGFRVAVESELLLVTYVANNGLTWLAETVEGTTAATHSAGASVTQVFTAGAAQQIITDHRAVGSPSANPHPMYVRKGSPDSWMTNEWGLTPSTTVDQTAAMQDAIDALAASGGGTIWLGPGTYMVRGITLKTGVWLRGSGMYSTIIKLIAGSNQPVITAYASPDAVVSNAFMVGVLDLMVHGNRLQQNASNTAHGIVATTNPLYTKATLDYDQDPHHLFQNVHIRDVAGIGLTTYGRGETRCINVHVVFGQSYGFYLGNDSFLSFCTAGQTAQAGFVGVNAGSGRLVGCKSFYCGRLIDQGTYAGNNPIAPGFWFANCFSMSLVDCEAQDCLGQGFFLEGSHRMTFAGCVADSNSVQGVGLFAGFHLFGSDFCTVSSGIAFERFQDGVARQIYALKLDGGDDHNDITLTHSGSNGAVVSAPIFPGSTITSSSVRINGCDVGLQAPAFAASYTPDPYSGQFVEMTLTGAITVNAPASPYTGQQLTFIFIQDATGGRVVTWNAVFKVTWTPTTTAARKNTISFVYDGAAWIQIGTAINLP